MKDYLIFQFNDNKHVLMNRLLIMLICNIYAQQFLFFHVIIMWKQQTLLTQLAIRENYETEGVKNKIYLDKGHF